MNGRQTRRKPNPAKIVQVASPVTVVHEYKDAAVTFPAQCTELAKIRRFAVSTSVLDIMRQHLLHHGAEGNEGALCWAGTVIDDMALVTTALLFCDAECWGGIHVSSAHTGLLYAHCHARGLTLLAQVHSHPFGAFHSPVDERSPHSAELGFLSIVVPNFGACDYERFADWCIFEQVAYENWREWDPEERCHRIHLLHSAVGIP
jgi:hypothetical protein